MGAKRIFPTLSEDEQKNIKEWLIVKKDNLPDYIQKMGASFFILIDKIQENKSRTSSLLRSFRTAMGILPSSERIKKPPSLKSLEEKRKKLQEEKECCGSRKKWHKAQIKKNKMMEKNIDKKIKNIDEIILSKEEDLQIEKEFDEELKILESGGSADPTLIPIKETLMEGVQNQIEQSNVKLKLNSEIEINEYDDDDDDYDGNDDFIDIVSSDKKEKTDTKIFYETRTRYDFDIVLRRWNIKIEKGLDSNGNFISPSTYKIGPKGFQITWGFLANICLLVTQYAMPFERLARMLSTDEKSFPSSQIYRHFFYAAKHLYPIYLQLFKDLANSDILSGDDTTVRVVEAVKNKDKEHCPWDHYATQEEAENFLIKNPDDKTLGPRLAEELGFVFPKRNGDGKKKQVYTTVVCGKSSTEKESYIVFYRSHFGHFGNLLDVLLMMRDAEKTTVKIQSDLSSSNTVSHPILLKKLNILYFGCGAHARRPFVKHADDDVSCAAILSRFQAIFHDESCLNVWGRNKTNVVGLRQKSSLPCWEENLASCENLATRWSSSTPIGTAARYIINNYKTLTAYIDHPDVQLSNNLAERLLRVEKLLQNNSLFRLTLEGRFALDICRTIVQTTLAANIRVKDYLIHVFKTKKEDLEKNPHLYTPLAYAKQTKPQ